MFEFAKFEAGTKAVMDAVVEATNKGATSIIGICFNCYILGFVMSSTSKSLFTFSIKICCSPTSFLGLFLRKKSKKRSPGNEVGCIPFIHLF